MKVKVTYAPIIEKEIEIDDKFKILDCDSDTYDERLEKGVFPLGMIDELAFEVSSKLHVCTSDICFIETENHILCEN